MEMVFSDCVIMVYIFRIYFFNDKVIFINSISFRVDFCVIYLNGIWSYVYVE